MQAYCMKCGQETTNQDPLCQRCGSLLEQPSQALRIPRTFVGKRILGVIGLVGGILVLVGVFGPWLTMSGPGFSAHVSAWDSITQATRAGAAVDLKGWAILALVGALCLVAGALSAVAAPHIKALWGIVLTAGLVAVGGVVWAYADTDTTTVMGISIGYGYGAYLTLVGGILGLTGALGLRG